jgi:hypothetical protein
MTRFPHLTKLRLRIERMEARIKLHEYYGTYDKKPHMMRALKSYLELHKRALEDEQHDVDEYLRSTES